MVSLKKILYSMYFTARAHKSIGSLSIFISYCLAFIATLFTINFMALISLFSFISVAFGGNSISLPTSYYYFLAALAFSGMWLLFGGVGGVKDLIARYDADPNINGNVIFNRGLGFYMLMSLASVIITCVSAYYEGKIIRGEF